MPQARTRRGAHTWARARRRCSSIVKASTLAQLGNIVIVDVGYNDPANNYETDMAQVANALVERGVAHVIWVTLREQTDDYRTINDVIRSQAPRWPQLQIADWEAASRGKDWFNPDGLHLNAAGAIGLATLLRPFVLTACGSACKGLGAGAPRNVRLPSLRGKPAVGRTLTCRHGLVGGAGPIVFSYRWLRGTRVLTHAVGSSRVLDARRPRPLVACRVWAGNASGATAATSKSVRVRAGGARLLHDRDRLDLDELVRVAEERHAEQGGRCTVEMRRHDVPRPHEIGPLPRDDVDGCLHDVAEVRAVLLERLTEVVDRERRLGLEIPGVDDALRPRRSGTRLPRTRSRLQPRRTRTELPARASRARGYWASRLDGRPSRGKSSG